MKDFNSAESQYKLAIKYDDENPSSYYLLARLYHTVKRYDDAKDVYEKLLNMGWASEEYIDFGKSIYTGYFLALLYSGKYDIVFEKTKKWKESGVYRSTLGTYRASAWKRKMEGLVDTDHKQTVDALVRASRILSDVFRNEGYSRTANNQALKIFKEIEFCFSRQQYYVNYKSEGEELVAFVYDHIFEINQLNNYKDIDELISKFNKLSTKDNQFKNVLQNINNSPNYEYSDDKDYDTLGLIEVYISNRPKDKVSYLFSKDSGNKKYFLHFDNFRDGGWREWSQLSIGEKLYIMPSESNETGKAINAKEIYLDSVS